MDKSGKIKLAIIMAAMTVLLALFIGGAVNVQTPPSTVTSVSSGGFDISCNSTPTTNYNVTNVSIYMSWTDGVQAVAWHQNISFTQDLVANTSTDVTYNLSNFTDGTTFSFGCLFEETWYNQSANASHPGNPYPSAGLNRTSWSDNTTLDINRNQTTTLLSPASGSTFLNVDFDLVCNSTQAPFADEATQEWNFTNASFYTDMTGSWIANVTNTSRSVNGTSMVWRKVITGMPDNTSFKWNCLAYMNLNDTHGMYASEWAASNRTVSVELPPTVTVQFPADGAFITRPNPNINFTSVTAGGTLTSSDYECRLFTNETTGNFTSRKGVNNVANNTPINLSYNFEEDVDVLFGVECLEEGDSAVRSVSSNQTVRLDRTAPSVVLNTPSGNFTTDMFTFNVTATDAWVKNCTLYGNWTGSWHRNQSSEWNGSTGIQPFGGQSFNFTDVIQVGQNGTFVWNAFCVDNATNGAWATSNLTFQVDTLFPNITTQVNFTAVDNTTDIALTVVLSEASNLSIFYGTSVAGLGNSENEAGFATNYTVEITNVSYEELMYFNITFCDVTGNCNASALQYVTIAPRELPRGWSVYAMLEDSMNMSQIANQLNYRGKSVYIYRYNQTNQSWDYHLAGSATGGENNISYGEAVFVFEPVNGTWFHTDRLSRYANFTLRKGYNFIGLTHEYSFFNLSTSFLNATYSQDEVFMSHGDITLANLTQYGQTCGACLNVTNFTFYSYYNNSDQKYANHIRNWSWFNTSALKRGWMVQVFSYVNVTWNGTTLVRNVTG